MESGPNLHLHDYMGVISGKPTVKGTFRFTVQVVDTRVNAHFQPDSATKVLILRTKRLRLLIERTTIDSSFQDRFYVSALDSRFRFDPPHGGGATGKERSHGVGVHPQLRSELVPRSVAAGFVALRLNDNGSEEPCCSHSPSSR